MVLSDIKGYTFNYTPLSVNCTLTIDDTVPDEQVYNAYLKQYVPDYTAVPLTLRPRVTIIDKDGVLVSGIVNSKLANITWTEVVGTTSTLITSESEGYSMTTSGDDNGLLRISKNFTPGTGATLKFTAEYTDSRTGQVFHLKASYLVKCNAASKSIPELTLDVDESHVYNPLRDADTAKVTAQLYVDGGVCPTAMREFVWDISRDGKSYTDIGSSNLDYFIKVSADKTYCTVDQTLMGQTFILRCRAKYDEGGNPSSIELDSASPSKSVTFTRRIPEVEATITGVPLNIPVGLQKMQVDLIIQDSKGVIDSATWAKVYQAIFYSDAQTAAGTAKPSTVRGYGAPCTLSTGFISTTYGCVLGVELLDRGPLAPWADSDGKVLVDSDGAILVIN
jgi:hypothetical protein